MVPVALGQVSTSSSPTAGIILAGFGVILAWAGWQGRARYRRLAEAGVKTQAQVIRMRRFSVSGGRSNGGGNLNGNGMGFVNGDGSGNVNVDGGGYAYKPIVCFRTPDGQQVTAEPRTSMNMTRLQVGEQVSVLYDPANPRNIRLDDYENSWTQSFLLGVGALVVIGGVAMTISTVIT